MMQTDFENTELARNFLKENHQGNSPTQSQNRKRHVPKNHVHAYSKLWGEKNITMKNVL
jgi:hypothetical protein